MRIVFLAKYFLHDRLDIVYLTLSTLLRLFSSLFVFVILARFLGPNQFSYIATALTLSTVAGLFTDWGLTAYSLKINSSIDNWTEEFDFVVTAKAILSLTLYIPFIVVCGFFFVDTNHILVTSVIYIGFSVASVADLAFNKPRVKRQFKEEFSLLLFITPLTTIFFISLLLVFDELLEISIAYAVSRALYFGYTMYKLNIKIFHRPLLKGLNSRLSSLLILSFRYAVDNITGIMTVYLDSMLVIYYYNSSESGYYLAISKLAQMTFPLSAILSTVYITRLSRYYQVIDGEHASRDREQRRMDNDFFFGSILVFLILASLGSVIIHTLYGSNYENGLISWPALVGLTVLRFYSSNLSVRLFLLGSINARVFSTLIGIGIALILTYRAQNGNIYHIPISVLIGLIATLGMQWYYCRIWEVGSKITTLRTIIIILLVILFCITNYNMSIAI